MGVRGEQGIVAPGGRELAALGVADDAQQFVVVDAIRRASR
jgi:hypothetical protein